MIVPPCINKYYILDLQPENSFVRYAVGEGHTVFMVSWRNMPDAMGNATWDDYLDAGRHARRSTWRRRSAARDKVNALGLLRRRHAARQRARRARARKATSASRA